jgi:hypothetical protein
MVSPSTGASSRRFRLVDFQPFQDGEVFRSNEIWMLRATPLWRPIPTGRWSRSKSASCAASASIHDPERLISEIAAGERQRNDAGARLKWMFSHDQ